MSLQHTNTELKWWHLGACRGLDSKIFYPDDEASSIFAKSVCSTCSVQTECLEHALTIREKAGVWRVRTGPSPDHPSTTPSQLNVLPT